MDQLHKQVRRVQNFLFWQQVAKSLPWCWFLALLVAAAVVAVDKFYPLGITLWPTVGVALGAGALLAIAWSYWRRSGPVDAAIEIDRRFGLKERVSSTLALAPADLDSPAGAALARDAIRRVEKLDLRERFKYSLSRWSWLPVVPAAITFAVALLVGSAAERTQAIAKTEAINVKKQVQNSTSELKKKLTEVRKEAKREGLTDAEDLLTKLELATERDLTKNPGDRKEALVKLNDLTKAVQERRSELARTQQLQQQLSQLKNMQKGPADKFADALKDGNFKQALQELDKLKEQLKQGELSEADQEKLAKQLDQMREKLQQASNAQQEMKKKLEQQLAEKQQAGQKQEAEALQKQLDAINQQMSQQQRLDQLAQKLGECSQCMKQGQMDGAMAKLQDMQGDLEGMKSEMSEGELLDQAMDEIASAKDALNCKECNGQGCQQCQGIAQSRQRGGSKAGRGRGAGGDPDEGSPTQTYDSAVKLKTSRGAATVVGEADGANLKGGVRQEIQAQVDAARAEAADPLTGQRLPKSSEQHAREYFNGLREGKK